MVDGYNYYIFGEIIFLERCRVLVGFCEMAFETKYGRR